MGFNLLLSAVASSIIATGVMVFFLYLPLLWRGSHFDVLGALGSAITKELNGRSRFLGALAYGLGGFVFAVFYGWLVLVILRSGAPILQLIVLENLSFPAEINLFFPILGLALGLAHGIFVALIMTIIIEHHPLEQFRSRYILIISQVISHLAFGATVMFFHSQFLVLLQS